MDTLAPLNRAKLKRQAATLLKSAEQILLQGASQAAGFADPADFKRSLIAALSLSEHFEEAARDFHAPLRGPKALGPWQKLGKDASQFKAEPRPSGRVQAPHFDPSHGQKDRQRGIRLKGGRVRLGQKRASREPGRSGRRK